MATQRIIWPWETRGWQTIRQRLSDPINSIVAMDTLMTTLTKDKNCRPRQVSELFNLYYREEYSPHVTQELFVEKILPWMQALIVNAPKTFKKSTHLKFLTPGISTNIHLTRLECVTLNAMAWFSLFDYDYVGKGKLQLDDMPTFSFSPIFANQCLFGLQALLNYFHRMFLLERNMLNAQLIIIQRSTPTEEIDWTVDSPLAEVLIGDHEDGHIDSSMNTVHVAFARNVLGGDKIFAGSLAQEEITFLIRPETMMALFFCPRLMQDTICIYGAEKMTHWTGYGSSVRSTGPYIENLKIGYSADDTEAMAKHAVIFMDATHRTSGAAQMIDDFQRDLNKAYLGFKNVHGDEITTGNWTCGYNGNHMQVKFLQQLLAASVCGKKLEYYPHGTQFKEKLLPFIQWCIRCNVTVGELYIGYKKLIKRYRSPHSKILELDVFECLMDE